MRERIPGKKIFAALLVAGAAPLALLLLLLGSPAAAPGQSGEAPIYDSTNTDGQGGSGGPAVVYQAGGRVVTDPSVTAGAPDSLLFRTGFGGWEPTLGLDQKGTIFYNARNNNLDPGVVRSSDGGVTWESVGAPEHRTSLDPFTHVDRSTGRVFTSDIDPKITCSPFSYTDDGGKSWSASEVCGETDHQNVSSGPPPQGTEQPQGYPNVVYFCAISGGTLADSSTATACSKSLDGGDSFTPTGDFPYPPRTAPPEVGNGLPFCDGATGHSIVDSRGTIYVPRAWCRQPHVAISKDQGETWKQVQVSDKLTPRSPEEESGVHEAGIAADQAGNLYFTWVSEDHHPQLSISRDGGETWGRPLDLLPPGVHRVSAFTASVDIGTPGRLALVLMGTRDQSDSPEEDTEDTSWDGYIVTSRNALDADPTFFANSVNDPETNPLWKGSCGEVRCGNTGDFMDVVIGPDGGTYAAFIDSCPGEVNDPCSSFGVTDPRGEAILGRLAPPPSDPTGDGSLVDETLTCQRQLATIAGGAGVDELTGSDGDDVILAAAGADVIDAGKGNDIICGRGGADVIKGGAGKDLVVGNTDGDRLSGSGGADRLRGNSDRDRVSGGKGKDEVRGGTKADRLGGGKGKDRLKGLGGNDRLGGGPGADTLQGLGGSDRLAGGGGRDTLRGGSGEDRCQPDGGDVRRSCEG